MKKFLVALVMSFALMFSTACSDDSDTGPTEQVTVTAEAPSTTVPETTVPPAPPTTSTAPPPPPPTTEAPESDPALDQAFLTNLREAAPFYNDVPDQDLIDLAKAMCVDLDNGVHIDAVSEFLFELGVPTVNAVAAFEVFGVLAYCPQHEGKL